MSGWVKVETYSDVQAKRDNTPTVNPVSQCTIAVNGTQELKRSDSALLISRARNTNKVDFSFDFEREVLKKIAEMKAFDQELEKEKKRRHAEQRAQKASAAAAKAKAAAAATAVKTTNTVRSPSQPPSTGIPSASDAPSTNRNNTNYFNANTLRNQSTAPVTASTIGGNSNNSSSATPASFYPTNNAPAAAGRIYGQTANTNPPRTISNTNQTQNRHSTSGSNNSGAAARAAAVASTNTHAEAAAMFRTEAEIQAYVHAVEMGFDRGHCRFAVEAFPGNKEHVVDCLTKLQYLSSIGFAEEKIKEALLLHNRDLHQCIDYLSK